MLPDLWVRDGAAPPELADTISALQRAAERRPTEGITLLSDDPDGDPDFRTWPELLDASARAATALAEHGVVAGEPVMLLLPTGWGFLTAFFALHLLEAVAVPAYPPTLMARADAALARLAHVGADAGVTRIVTDKTLIDAVSAVAPDQSVLDVDTLTADTAHPIRPPPPDAVAVLQYTSGSTGRPKGVPLTHRNILANCHAVGTCAGVFADDVVVSWLPLYHDLGLFTSMLSAVYWALPLVLMSPLAFMLSPMRWLEAIDTYSGTICQAPNFAYARVLRRAPTDLDLDLSSWRVGLITAEPVDPAVVRAFQSQFEAHGLRPDTILPGYGFAEATAGVTLPHDHRFRVDRVNRARLAEGYAEPTDSDAESVDLPCQGAALPGHAIRVVDNTGAPCADRHLGEIHVQGASVMGGYHGRGLGDGLADGGWYATGDIGYLVDGELYLAGRSREIVIVRGRNHHPADLEWAAERVPAVRPGGVVAFGDSSDGAERAVLVCETSDPGDAARLRRQVARAVSEATGVRPDAVALVAPGTLPRTPSGKRQRRLARALWRDGRLPDIAPTHPSRRRRR